MIIAQIPTASPVVTSINPVEIISCPAITKYMQFGNNNDPKEVANLQSTLKNIESIEVDVTGIFDDKTTEAVRVFQRKYMEEVMSPWEATRPSGIVNITTAKKINNIACKTPMTLSEAELSVINAYKVRLAASGGTIGAQEAVNSPAINDEVVLNPSEIENVSVEELTYKIDDEDLVENDNVASVGASDVSQSMSARFWRYFRGLFGR